MKRETLLKMAAWFEAHGQKRKCKGCRRRAFRMARIARKAANG